MQAAGSIIINGIIDGEDGKGITTADVMFCIINGTGTPADTAGWKTTVAQLSLSDSTKEYYLWQATYITYTDGTHAYTGKVCLGQVKDFASVTEQYARGTATAADSTTWQDNTPPAPQKGSYLWTRTKLVFANGSISYQPSSAGYCLGYYGQDGTSPWFADLDNEMDSVACGADGRPVSATTLETTVSLWHGSTLQNITSVTVDGTAISTTAKTIGIFSVKYVVVDTKKRKIQVTVGTTSVLPLTNSLAIEVSDGTETRRLSFVINGVRPGSNGQPATVFSLVPSTSAIKKDKGGTLSPASPMTCNVLKKVGNAAAVNATSADGTLRYSVDGDITSSTQGTEWTSGSSSVSVEYTASNKYITFAFFVGTTLVDKERVPIVYDGNDGAKGDKGDQGEKGDNGYGIALTLTRSGLYTDANWDTYGEIGHSEHYGKRTCDPDLTVCRVGDYFVVTGTSSDSGRMHTVTYKCTAVSDSSITGTSISHVKDGAQGQSIQGHTGRWYEYAGEYGNGLADTLTNSDDHGWFVKRGNYFFMLIADSDTSVSTSTIPTSNTSNSNWEYMGGDRQYYIAKAFFGDYAQFGSFIINDQWMISTNGTLNGTAYNNGQKYGTVEAYTYFDGAYPLGTRNLGISVSGITGTTPTQRGAAFTLEGRRLVKVTGRVNTSSATMYVALYTAAGASISSPQSITSTSDTSLVFTFYSGSDTEVCIRAWMSSSSMSLMGTITAATVETFAPNFAVDGLTGKTIQINSIVKGTIMATGGEFLGDMLVGAENSDNIKIVPSGISIVGNDGTEELYRLSSKSTSIPGINGTSTKKGFLKIGESYIDKDELVMKKTISNKVHGSILDSNELMMYRPEHTFEIMWWTNNKITFGSPVDLDIWPTSRTDVPVGCVYLDGDVLKVRTS